MPLQLRSARAADAATIASLHLASWRDAYRGVLGDDFLDGEAAALLPAHWDAALAQRPMSGVVLLAIVGGSAAGFAAVWREGRLAVVDNLHVRPGLRGAGIGRALLGQAAERMHGRGCTSAELRVFAANADAIRFYIGLRGELGPEQPAEVFGQPVVERACAWPEITRLIAAAAQPKPR